MEQDAAMAVITAMTDQVLEERPNDATARALSVIASVWRQVQTEGLGSFPAAVTELEAIVDSDPGNALEPKIILTRFYQDLDRREDAVALLETALEKDPYNPSILYELGSQYAALERWDESRAALAASLEIEPAQPNAYSILAVSALLNGDGAEYLQQSLRAIEVDPYDHEMPGVVAELLYQLGLVEEADDFRRRVLAIAPTSEMAYRLELLRAISTDDVDAGLAAARQAIVDDVGNRRFTYVSAVSYLLRTAIRQDRVEEELAWLDAQEPGILDVTADTAPQKHRNAQGVAFDAWFVSLPREELISRLETLLALYQDVGFEVMDDAGTAMAVTAIRGDNEAALDIALDRFFTQPVAMNLGWRRTLAQAQYAPMLEDERIKAAIQRWEDQEAELREQIRNWLNDLSAAEGSAAT